MTRCNYAKYGDIIFEVEEDHRSIIFLNYTQKINKKIATLRYAVDSKRCKIENNGEEDYWNIRGINSVKPV